jgi:oligopeptide/dipeptide ABC transporter ATP-binding protein
MAGMFKNILEVRDLRTHFFTRRGIVRAVDGISFSIKEGECLGLVGESGCGKSITALSILRLIPEPAGRIVAGDVLLDGENLLRITETQMRRTRGRKVSIILQDPMGSLNPVFTIGDQLGEVIRVHQKLRRASLRDKAKEMLRWVQISSPELALRYFPHQMSGGMRQRVVGAMALACQPRLLIADEPTTSLDVTIQAQYLSLLKEIQTQTNKAMLFITHDFGIVALMCDRVAVMYAGKIVEVAEVRELFYNPAHPYTDALIRSVPNVEQKVQRLQTIEGQPPPLYSLPTGCSFHPRCLARSQKCQSGFPPEVKIKDNHVVNCWKYI